MITFLASPIKEYQTLVETLIYDIISINDDRKNNLGS